CKAILFYADVVVINERCQAESERDVHGCGRRHKERESSHQIRYENEYGKRRDHGKIFISVFADDADDQILKSKETGFGRKLAVLRIVFGKLSYQKFYNDEGKNTRNDEHY